jgi:hypothetical protein
LSPQKVEVEEAPAQDWVSLEMYNKVVQERDQAVQERDHDRARLRRENGSLYAQLCRARHECERAQDCIEELEEQLRTGYPFRALWRKVARFSYRTRIRFQSLWRFFTEYEYPLRTAFCRWIGAERWIRPEHMTIDEYRRYREAGGGR